MARGKNAAASQRKYDRWAEEELEKLRGELSGEKRRRLDAERKLEGTEPLRQRLAELEQQIESGETPRIASLTETITAERSHTQWRLSRIGQLFNQYISRGTDGWTTSEWEELNEVLGETGMVALMGDRVQTRYARRSLAGKKGDFGAIIRGERS